MHMHSYLHLLLPKSTSLPAHPCLLNHQSIDLPTTIIHPPYQLSINLLDHLLNSRSSTTVRRWMWMPGRWGCSSLGWSTTPPMSSRWPAKKAWTAGQDTAWLPRLRHSSWSRNPSWTSTLSLTTCSPCPSHRSIPRTSSKYSLLKDGFCRLNYLWGLGYLGLSLDVLEIWCDMDWDLKVSEMLKWEIRFGISETCWTLLEPLLGLTYRFNFLSTLWRMFSSKTAIHCQ